MPKITAFGGGTGLSNLLRGLKAHTDRITAVVTVCDNGGSSGRLRREFDVPPPGDIRNCLAALADTEPLMEELLQYRFEESEMEGHSLGNLLLTALTRITGDFGIDKQYRTVGPALKMQKAGIAGCEDGRLDVLYGYPNEKSEPVQRRAGF